MKLVCIFLSAIIMLSAAFVVVQNNCEVSLETFVQTNDDSSPIIILDAGHGGEDGGAVADDGTVEKDINLAITKNIALLFDLFGINYIAVRTQDISVCDDGLDSIRKRKSSDILNRQALVDTTDNAILLSIHQNYFTQPQYSGTQVFYSSNTPESSVLAQEIQQSVKEGLQPENDRTIKASGDNIYLLYHATKTAVMVECGFLSNKEELSLLKTDSYKSQLSYFIVKGLLTFINKGEF